MFKLTCSVVLVLLAGFNPVRGDNFEGLKALSTIANSTVKISTRSGVGTGIRIRHGGEPDRIRIATAKHVVEGKAFVRVEAFNGTVADNFARVVYEHPTQDFAVIESKSKALVELVAVDVRYTATHVSDFAVSAGHSAGGGIEIHIGQIEGAKLSGDRDQTFDLVSHGPKPGMSGGGVFDSQMRLIGIVAVRTSEQNPRLGFTPISALKDWGK